MASPRILISGSGIAGSAFAHWALRAFPLAKITVLERGPGPRLTGSSIDLRSSAVDIIKYMGLEPEIRAHTTTEKGFRFVDAKGKTIATLGASGRSDVQSITSEYEIFRSDLARILLDGSKDRIALRFGDYVERYEEGVEGVEVTYAKSRRSESFDLLVAADGVGSLIRGQLLGRPYKEQVYDEGVHVAYFTQKADLLQGSKFAETYSAPGGRVIMVRPDPHPEGRNKALLLNVTSKKDTAMKKRLNDAADQGNEAYMALMDELFADVGGRATEVLKGMREADDFYCSLFAQVRSPKLVSDSGRVVLLGDAGYATPGLGTSLAIMGAYVLAGEMLTTMGAQKMVDFKTAAEKYQNIMLPFVKSQQGDDGAMQMINPQTTWGLRIRNAILRVLTGLYLDQLAMLTAAKLGIGEKKLKLPDYAWPQVS